MFTTTATSLQRVALPPVSALSLVLKRVQSRMAAAAAPQEATARLRSTPLPHTRVIFPLGVPRQAQRPLYRTKHYAILETGLVSDDLSHYGSYPSMFMSWLRDTNLPEKWDVFRVCDGTVPSLESLEHYDGILITGSRHAAYDQLDWIEGLKDVIRHAVARRQKLLGICFGHQLIGAALGGEVKKIGWLGGAHEIRCTEAMKLHYNFESPSYKALQSHSDQLVTLPEGAVLLASSDQCPIEAFHYPAYNPAALCVQYHPELQVAYMRDNVELKERKGVITPEVAQRVKASMPPTDEHAVNPRHMREWLKSWFKASPVPQDA